MNLNASSDFDIFALFALERAFVCSRASSTVFRKLGGRLQIGERTLACRLESQGYHATDADPNVPWFAPN